MCGWEVLERTSIVAHPRGGGGGGVHSLHQEREWQDVFAAFLCVVPSVFACLAVQVLA